MILKIAEQEVLRLSEKNRVVAHVAVGNLREHLRPYRRVRCLVLGYPLRLDADHHAHALHRRVPPIVCLSLCSRLGPPLIGGMCGFVLMEQSPPMSFPA